MTADASSLRDEADPVAEDEIGRDHWHAPRRAASPLTKLDFDVHASGKFDDYTRSVIKR